MHGDSSRVRRPEACKPLELLPTHPASDPLKRPAPSGGSWRSGTAASMTTKSRSGKRSTPFSPASSHRLTTVGAGCICCSCSTRRSAVPTITRRSISSWAVYRPGLTDQTTSLRCPTRVRREAFHDLREFHRRECPKTQDGGFQWNYIALAPHIDEDKGLLKAQRAQVLESFPHDEIAGLELGDEKLPEDVLKKPSAVGQWNGRTPAGLFSWQRCLLGGRDRKAPHMAQIGQSSNRSAPPSAHRQ